MTLPLLLNRHGGSRLDQAEIERAFNRAGVAVEIETLDGKAIPERVAELAKGGAPAIAVAGGDGTLSGAAGALAGSQTALAIVPGGTRNHLARDLGIPFELESAACLIAAGNRRKIDLASVDGRYFVNNCAIGLYPLMVLDREAQQHHLGRSKRLAMLVASLRTMVRFHDERLRLRINDSAEELLDTPLLFVGNNDYRLDLPDAGRRDQLDDGRLCVVVMRKKGLSGFAAATVRALFGLTRSDDMVRLDDVTRLAVSSARRHLLVAVDGETIRLETPLDFRIHPASLTVIAPAP